MPLMNCGNDSPSPGSSCSSDSDCGENQHCIADECEDDNPDDGECENFFSCETSADCVALNRGFTTCDDQCCF